MGAVNSITRIFWREELQTQSINPNSMSPVPKNKFINFAREKSKNIDDIPTFKMYGKSKKQKKALDSYYDFYNH